MTTFKKRQLSIEHLINSPPPWFSASAKQMQKENQKTEDLSINLRKIISWIGIGWSIWALTGGFYFLTAKTSDNVKQHWMLSLDGFINGYKVVGISLMLCGILSSLGMFNKQLNKIAALCSAAWCLIMAIALQLYRPGFDEADIDAWLLLICSFSCVMRWALLVLEPHINEN